MARTRKSHARRRLPNGFGQITKITGKYLRSPYRAMITVGKDASGRPICKLLKPQAYFKTYNDAYAALLEYHKNPYDIASEITMSELYDRWLPEYIKSGVSHSAISGIKSAWHYCSAIYDIRVSEVRARHIRSCIENAAIMKKENLVCASANIQIRIKSLFNMMFDYAVEYELTDKNYARNIGRLKNTEQETGTKKEHLTFSEEEMQALWNAAGTVTGADLILIQCYSGWRPGELGLIETDNVDIVHWSFSGGIKTESGKNRGVPIHSKIRPFVLSYYNKAKADGCKYVFSVPYNRTGQIANPMTYKHYKLIFANIIKNLGMNPLHRAHDPRKQFVTMGKKAGVNEYALKKMVGHIITDLTERVYTDRDLEWLRNEIEKI